MYLIGVCGKSGSGKSCVCSVYAGRGAHCIDADAVCRRVYESSADCVSELCARFGRDIAPEGSVDRALLFRRAFADAKGVADLNAISHKYIVAEILAEAERAFADGASCVIADAPALFESGLNSRCDAVIAVFADEKARYSRLRLRENIGKDAFKKRQGAQKSDAFLLKNCDAAVYNKGSLKELELRAHRAMLLVQIKLGVLRAQKEKKRYVLEKTPR